MDSDVDLIVLTGDTSRYIEDEGWIAALGGREVLRTQRWGLWLTERRFSTGSGLEVEVDVTETAWAATNPVDPVTASVVGGGLRVLHDPHGQLRALVGALLGTENGERREDGGEHQASGRT